MSQLHLLKKLSSEDTLEDLFDAYFDARRNKRNTINALIFEKDFEKNLFCLFKEISERRYKPRRSICFVVNRPVKREIFAANFRDRVIHHFVHNYIYQIFEKILIHDTYSCRKGKGVHYGIKRVDYFIRSCSDNYQKECYVLKMDIKEYFMSISKDILYNRIKDTLFARREKINFDLSLVLYLLKRTIYNEPTKDCIVKGKKSNWDGLPETKSLFGARPNCGLPIGNLTSQLFGNVYLNDFDHFIKKDLGIRYYGRYVDDFVIVHSDKEYLKSIMPKIKDYLEEELKLVLHPKKVYFQQYKKGIVFLGAIIKPNRIYIANRTKGNFYATIKKYNSMVRKKKPSNAEIERFLSSINSYLGMMKHWKTYNLRKKIIAKSISAYWWNHTYVNKRKSKLVSR